MKRNGTETKQIQIPELRDFIQIYFMMKKVKE